MSTEKENKKNYHLAVAEVSGRIVKFFNKTFAKAVVDGPEIDAEDIQRNSPVMFVCSHRSHVDYFYIGSNFCLMGFRNIRFAAGDNLTKLPWIGKKFTNFGAFAVSRGGGFERNYVRNLCAKVVEMLTSGDTVLVFPEGGRSYSGAMLDIKGGILNAAIMTQAANMDRDVFLIPSSVSYESPPDVPWFPLLLKGKKLRKKPTNFFKSTLGSIYYFGADILAFAPFMIARFFGKKYGAAYMDYGQPISVKSLVDIEKNRIEGARDEFAAHRVSLDILSDKIYKIFVDLYRILPIHVTAQIIKTKCAENDSPVTKQDLIGAVDEFKAELNKSGRNCKTLNELSAKEIVSDGLKILRKLKAINSNDDNIAINQKKSYVIKYYAAAFDVENS